MTIPAAPLPSLRALAAALVAPPLRPDRWTADRPGYTARLFPSGRRALAAAVTAAGPGSVTVHAPDYFCNEALELLRRAPDTIRVEFHPVREDLTPDWEMLEREMARSGGSRVLVLVHYFGFPGDVATARSLCVRQGTALLEDAAHVLRPTGRIGAGDLVVYSLRKVLAVPSGSVLVLPEAFAGRLGAQDGGSAAAATARWLVRRVVQGAFIRMGVPWHRLWSTGTDGGAVLADVPGGDVGSYVRRLLAASTADLNHVAARRRENYLRLLEWAERWGNARPVFAGLAPDVCPYAFPLIVEHAGNVVAALRRRGIPASRWPDLAPEVLAAPRDHHEAIRLYERLVLLPVHQSLSPAHMDLIGRAVGEVLAAAA